MAYTLNIPQASDLISDSQPKIRDNFNQANTSFAIDHYAFADTTAQNGQHKVIQQYQSNITRSGASASYTNAPAANATINKIFSAAYTPQTTGGTADTQLFSITGTGVISQLTGSLTSSATEGYCWSGGILFQWGRVVQSFSSGSTTGTVTFKDRDVGAIPFPTQCWVVMGSPLINTGSLPNSQGSVNIARNTLARTFFDWQFYTNSADYKGFTWIAIGN